MRCPARRSVAPTRCSSSRVGAAGPGRRHTAASVTAASGLAVELDTSDAVEHEQVATVPTAGVRVIFTYGETDALAQQILQSLRVAE